MGRVNVDLTQGMLTELDARASRLNVSRQAVIKISAAFGQTMPTYLHPLIYLANAYDVALENYH